MNLKSSLLLGSMLAAALMFPGRSEAQSAFVHSALGPGASKTAVNLGIRAYAPTVDNIGDGALPTVDFNLVHGINNTFDYELRISTLGLISLIDTGIKARLIGGNNFSVGARLGASGLLVIIPAGEEGAVGGLFGITPGVVASLGSSRFQFSAGLDVPLLLGAAAASDIGGVQATGGDSVFGYVLRPWIGVEFPIGTTVNMTAQAQAYVSAIDKTTVAPNLAVGISW